MFCTTSLAGRRAFSGSVRGVGHALAFSGVATASIYTVYTGDTEWPDKLAQQARDGTSYNATNEEEAQAASPRYNATDEFEERWDVHAAELAGLEQSLNEMMNMMMIPGSYDHDLVHGVDETEAADEADKDETPSGSSWLYYGTAAAAATTGAAAIYVFTMNPTAASEYLTAARAYIRSGEAGEDASEDADEDKSFSLRSWVDVSSFFPSTTDA